MSHAMDIFDRAAMGRAARVSEVALLGEAPFGNNAGEALYLRFERILRRSIANGGLPKGTVLLEGHLAELLGSSRAPVRQALGNLQDAGLLQRFRGRGYLVGQGDPEIQRIELTAD